MLHVSRFWISISGNFRKPAELDRSSFPPPWAIAISARGRIILRLIAIIGILALFALHADAVSPDYPQTYSDIVDAAKAEGQLVVYNTVHSDAALSGILGAFHKRYPFIAIKDSDGDAARTYARFIREIAAGKPSADFIWSLGMDLQEKLINDGFAQPYSSPETPLLPSWAHWRDLGYGVTLEPIAIVYNRRFLPNQDLPRTHAGLRDWLRSQSANFRGRVALYNPEKSEVGMLLLSEDARVTKDAWNLFDTFGALDAHLYSTSRDMLSHIVSGDQWVGYNVIASYAVEMQKKHPELAVVYPADYVLVMSRVAFISAKAAHPNAAKLFLDFLLSKEGQENFKNHSIGSVRADIGVPPQQSRLDPIRTQAIRIGPGLLSDLDSLVRAQFVRRWRESRSEVE